jgi:hypothetical protein
MLYTDIAAKLVKTDMSQKRIAAEKGKEAIISYVLDTTGLEAPICELVEKARPLADIKRVYITGGINTTEGSLYNEYHVPKGQLISGLLAAFDSKCIYMTRRSKGIKLFRNWPSLKYISRNPAGICLTIGARGITRTL